MRHYYYVLYSYEAENGQREEWTAEMSRNAPVTHIKQVEDWKACLEETGLKKVLIKTFSFLRVGK